MTARLITRIFSFFLLASALFDVSCTRVTDLRPEGRGEVVVVCVLTEEATQTLTLDLTDIASPEDRAALSEAEITLFDETAGQEVGSFQKEGGNDWQLEYAAIPEHKYRLQIFIPGREEISATTVMPTRSNIICYYRWGGNVVYDINSLPKGPLWVMGINQDLFKTGNRKVAEKMATSLITVDLFNVTGEVFHAEVFFPKEVLYVDPETGDRLFYPYVEGQPLYDKMLRIPSVQEKQRVAKEPVFSIVNQDLEHGTIETEFYSCFSVAGYFKTAYYPIAYGGSILPLEDTHGYVLFISPSEEYDKYLQEESMLKMQKLAMGDYAALFSRKNIYTNIVNGLGVFGALTSQKMPWNDTPIKTY